MLMCTRTSYGEKYRWKILGSWVSQTILIRLITSNILLVTFITVIYYIVIEVVSNK